MLTQLLLATVMVVVTVLIHGAGITGLARGLRIDRRDWAKVPGREPMLASREPLRDEGYMGRDRRATHRPKTHFFWCAYVHVQLEFVVLSKSHVAGESEDAIRFDRSHQHRVLSVAASLD